MPIYSIMARDYADGLERRLGARARHVALGDKMVAEGHLLFGAALIEDDKMRGSILIGKFADRGELKAWLDVEPYVVDKVWEHITIDEIRIGPSFLSKFPNI